MMTRTDAIIVALEAAVRAYADVIDTGSSPIRSVSVSVKMNSSTGQPRVVVANLEVEQEVHTVLVATSP